MSSYVIAFVAGLALDLLYCRWFNDVTQRRPVHASLASMAIGLFGILGVGQALANWVAAVCYIGGLGLGTLIGTYAPLRVQEKTS